MVNTIQMTQTGYDELAKELGYDAGFGMNTYADDVASFIAQEMARRMHRK